MMHQQHFNLSIPVSQKLNYPLSQSQRLGLFAERFVLGELEERGHAGRLLSDFSAKFDILLDSGLPIEVKIAKATSCHTGRQWRKRWQFCLQGGLNYKRQDFIYILIAVDTAGAIYLYIVPSAFVGTRQIISITSHPDRYRGQWAQYRDAWEWVDTVATWRIKYQQSAYGQMSFWGVTQ